MTLTAMILNANEIVRNRNKSFSIYVFEIWIFFISIFHFPPYANCNYMLEIVLAGWHNVKVAMKEESDQMSFSSATALSWWKLDAFHPVTMKPKPWDVKNKVLGAQGPPFQRSFRLKEGIMRYTRSIISLRI